MPRKLQYKDWSKEDKQKYAQTCYARRKVRKTLLVTSKGGKCQVCGYNKCMRALTFHHRDPKLKLFTLDNRQLASRTMDSLINEVAKCDLLCFNCHMEIEDVGTVGVEPT